MKSLHETLACPKPWVVAHRGDSRYFPENTISSFRSAIEKGAQMLECDIQLSRDRVPVAVHDGSLERTTSGRGKVCDWHFDELSKLDCGSWFSKQFMGETLLSLDQMLEVVSDQVLLNLEIKSQAAESETRADGVESLLCEMVHEHGLQETVLVSSFHHLSLKRVREHKHSLPVAPLLDRPATLAELQKLHQDHDAFSIHQDKRHIDQLLLQGLKESGIPVFCYTVNDPIRMKELSGWGITGIFSDDPELLRKEIS